MKSMTKKLTILLVVSLLLVTMCAMVACDPKGLEEKGEAGKFTVVVLLPDGTPAQGIYVQLCTIVNGDKEGCQAYKVDENGTVCVAIEGATLCEVELQQLQNLPSEYKVPEKYVDFHLHVGKKLTIHLEDAQPKEA